MLKMTGRHSFSSPDIVHEVFDGECTILNLATGRYFSLSKSGSVLVQHLLAGVSMDELVTLDGEGCTSADVQAFFAELKSLGLFAASDEPATPLDESLRQEAKGWTERPKVEVFDDLAELIIADPIHETDTQMGWPHLNKAA